MSSVVVSGVNPVTEDYTRIGGFIAGCGEASLLVILHATKGTPTDPTTLGNVIRSAASNGWVQSDGVSTPSGLSKLSASFGVPLTSGDYKTMLAQYAGNRPVIVGVANASAFGGRDAGVSGHYVAVVGKDPAGNFIVSDPNASSKFGRFDTYTPAQFAAARPFWAAVPTNWNGSSTSVIGNVTGTIGAGIGTAVGAIGGAIANNPLSPQTWLDALKNQFGTLFTWLSDPLRILKLVAGLGMIGAAVVFTVVGMAAKVAPDALEVAGAASGQPELIAAGKVAKATRSGGAMGGARSFAKIRQSRKTQAARAERQRKAQSAKTQRQQVRAAMKAAKKTKAAKAEAPKEPAPETPEETPVYYGGKRVGVERNGEVIMDKKEGT